MGSDLEVQRWIFTFDRNVPSPWLEDSGWMPRGRSTDLSLGVA